MYSQEQLSARLVQGNASGESRINFENRAQNNRNLEELILKAEEHKRRIVCLTFLNETIFLLGFALGVVGSIIFTIIALNNKNFSWGSPLGYEVYYVYAQVFYFGYGSFALFSQTVESTSRVVCLTITNMIADAVLAACIIGITIGQKTHFLSDQAYNALGYPFLVTLICLLIYLALVLFLCRHYREVLRNRDMLQRK